MTWPLYGIGWLELGEYQRAWSNIEKVYQNVVNGFQVICQIQLNNKFWCTSPVIYRVKYSNKASMYRDQELGLILSSKVWSEVKGGLGSPNFLTGMGGFLQSILFGYGGLRLKPDSLEINPTLPPNCDSMNFTGIDYMGNSLDLVVSDEKLLLTAFSEGSSSPSLCLHLPAIRPIKLISGKSYDIKRQKGYISKCLL